MSMIAGPGVPQHLAEGWPLRKGDFKYDNRYHKNVSHLFPWTKKDEEEEALLHAELAQYRNETGVAFFGSPEDNPLNLRITFPDHDKVFPMKGAATGDPARCINWTALEEAEIVESSELLEEGADDSDGTGRSLLRFEQYLAATKGNHTAMANLFHYTPKLPPANQTTRAQVYFGKRILDPMDPEDFKSILLLNYGSEPGDEAEPTRVSDYPEGRHYPETVFYSNQPGLVLNLVTFPCVGRDPRPPLLRDRVRHTQEFISEEGKRGVPVPQGRGTIVDVLGSRGVRCVVNWDESLANGVWGGRNSTCLMGYKRRYTLELARTGQNKWEEETLRRLEDLSWQGLLAPDPALLTKDDHDQMIKLIRQEGEEQAWRIRHNATEVMRTDACSSVPLVSPHATWNIPTYAPREALQDV